MIEPAPSPSQAGLRRLVWALRLGFLYLAGASLWRLSLYLFSLTSDAPLPMPAAALTFMPIPDALFTVLFVWLALCAGRVVRPAFAEMAIAAAGLEALALASYAIVFRGFTKGAAFTLDLPSTWLHALLPVAYCIWLVVKLLPWARRSA